MSFNQLYPKIKGRVHQLINANVSPSVHHVEITEGDPESDGNHNFMVPLEFGITMDADLLIDLSEAGEEMPATITAQITMLSTQGMGASILHISNHQQAAYCAFAHTDGNVKGKTQFKQARVQKIKDIELSNEEDAQHWKNGDPMSELGRVTEIVQRSIDDLGILDNIDDMDQFDPYVDEFKFNLPEEFTQLEG